MRDRVNPKAGTRAQALIRQALVQRWLEARALLRGVAERISDSTSDPTPEQEEALRLLMVNHYPKARAGKLVVPAWDAAQELFDVIVQPTTGDLRFLDAWNSFYEALGPRAKDEQSFLAKYVAVLDSYLHRATS